MSNDTEWIRLTIISDALAFFDIVECGDPSSSVQPKNISEQQSIKSKENLSITTEVNKGKKYILGSNV